MQVFKFGGASVNTANAIKNMAAIVKSHLDEPLVVIVSAMGKSTNALEQILSNFRAGKPIDQLVASFEKYHKEICKNLFDSNHEVFSELSNHISELEKALKQSKEESYDFAYDQCISFGELISTTILNFYFNEINLDSHLHHAPDLVITDRSYREAIVDWGITSENIYEALHDLSPGQVAISQGFISGDSDGHFTTLGREGSDYSASIFACSLKTTALTVWKDVPGIMNSDPEKFSSAVIYDELSYKEASEMSYYGAKVIHRDTIKPLADKNIPLYVKCFFDPQLPGTLIHDCHIVHHIPCIILKPNQCLVSFRFNDYTFINEQNIGAIFDVLDQLHIHVNMMQNSAISFSICIDNFQWKTEAIISKLGQLFQIHYNTNLILLTIKNYQQDILSEHLPASPILLEQRSRADLQMVYQD